jgi:hypothetical protein
MIEYITVPLVVYTREGERKIIGEATIRDTDIMSVLDAETAAEIIDMLEMTTEGFSIKPYKKAEQNTRRSNYGHEEAEASGGGEAPGGEPG